VIECFVLQNAYRENEKIKMRGVVFTQLPSEGELQDRFEQANDQISWLFNHAPVGIIFLSPEGTVIDGNQAAFQQFSLPSSSILQNNIQSFVRSDEIALLNQSLKNIATFKQNTSSIDIHLNHNNKDAVSTLYISAMKHVHAASSETIDGFVVYLIDSTRQKSLELQFAQAQKMQAVGQLAGGVAHDFNNLLTAMIGFTDLLLQRHGVGDPSFADLIQIKQNANRAAGLVRQLLAFSRKQPLQPKLIDVTENFAELSHMLKRILGEQVTLKFHHSNELGFIKVDPVQFSQVIINLAVNAKDAMNGNGLLTITTRTEVLNESYRFGDDTIKPGEFVVIDVIDNGCGIPPENLTRIFDPFFSTKENVVGSGTGLGLAMVYGIVRQTEGFIKVKSDIGIGTTFSIYLPRFESGAEVIEDKSSNEIVTGHDGSTILRVQEKIAPPVNINQKIIVGLNVSNAIDRTHTASNKPVRILFVEDEDSVRTFGIRALQKKGYEVIGCSSGENALEFIEKDNNFNLLITDMVMPGISGAKLTKQLKNKLPDLKVILASGYSEEIVRQELENFDDFDFITKPYSLGDLTAKVFDVLNRN
ncbi:MAG: response regulator, partial [Alphaproteobacteria bacterium]|nr:response regulator [Alphaproteobacteria bacterium]